MKLILGIFYMLHGLVHLLYMGYSLNYFELKEGFSWPHDSKLLTGSYSSQALKRISNVLCIIATISFMASGISVFVGYTWYNREIFSTYQADFTLCFYSRKDEVLRQKK